MEEGKGLVRSFFLVVVVVEGIESKQKLVVASFLVLVLERWMMALEFKEMDGRLAAHL